VEEASGPAVLIAAIRLDSSEIKDSWQSIYNPATIMMLPDYLCPE